MVSEIRQSLEVRNLPYKTMKALADLLDMLDGPGGDYYWRSLIGELPARYNYTPAMMNKLAMTMQRPGGSPGMSLLTDFGHQLMKVGELTTYLEAINLQGALLLLKPHEPVYIRRHPESVIVQAGQEIVLTCEATSFPLPSYQWLKNNAVLPNRCSSELKLTSVQEDASGEYCCKVSNPMGSECSATAQVQVTPVYVQIIGGVSGPVMQRNDGMSGPDISGNAGRQVGMSQAGIMPPDFGSVGFQEQTIFVYIGQYFELTCNRPARSYQWYKNSYPIRGACMPRLVYQPFGRGDEGYYCCLIDDGRQQMFTELAYLKSKDPTIPDPAIPNQQFGIIGYYCRNRVPVRRSKFSATEIKDGKIPSTRIWNNGILQCNGFNSPSTCSLESIGLSR